MTVRYYREADSTLPVMESLAPLTPEDAVVVDNQIDRLFMLDSDGPLLPEPWSTPLGPELHALRCYAGDRRLSIVYGRAGRSFVLLHAVWDRPVDDRDVAIAARRLRRCRGHK